MDILRDYEYYVANELLQVSASFRAKSEREQDKYGNMVLHFSVHYDIVTRQ
jgi:hypothetical protein